MRMSTSCAVMRLPFCVLPMVCPNPGARRTGVSPASAGRTTSLAAVARQRLTDFGISLNSLCCRGFLVTPC